MNTENQAIATLISQITNLGNIIEQNRNKLGESDIQLIKGRLLELYEQVILLKKSNPSEEQSDGSDPIQVRTTTDEVVQEDNDPDETHEEEVFSINEKYKKETPEIVDQMQTGSIQDLRTAIGINERLSFINELFEGNSSAYDDAVRRINDSEGIDSANTYIENELKTKYAWNDDAKPVAEFNQLVRRRFS